MQRFWIAFSEICCLWGVKANRLMDKDLGRAFNCRDFFWIAFYEICCLWGGEGQPADGQGPGQGFRGHAGGWDEAGSGAQEWWTSSLSLPLTNGSGSGSIFGSESNYNPILFFSDFKDANKIFFSHSFFLYIPKRGWIKRSGMGTSSLLCRKDYLLLKAVFWDPPY